MALLILSCSDAEVLHLDGQDVDERRLSEHFESLRVSAKGVDGGTNFGLICGELAGRSPEEQLAYLRGHPYSSALGFAADPASRIGKARPGQQADEDSVDKALGILQKECDAIPFEARVKPLPPDEPAKPVCLPGVQPPSISAGGAVLGGIDLRGLGTVRAFTVSGDLAYASVEGCIVVIDHSNPGQLAIVGGVGVQGGMPPASAFGLTAENGYLYAAVPYSGLQIFDIHQPRSPRLLSSADTATRIQGMVLDFAQDMALDGSLAYVASSELKVLDVSNPAAPRVVASLLVYGYGSSATLHQGHVYLTTDNVSYEGAQIVNVDNPASPVVVGALSAGQLGGNRTDVALHGSRAYMLAADQLHIFDVQNPAAPQKLGSVPVQKAAQHVAYAEERVLVTVASEFPYGPSMFSGIQVYDVRNAAAPRLVKSVELDSPTRINGKSIEIHDRRVFVMTSNGLRILDLDAVLAE